MRIKRVWVLLLMLLGLVGCATLPGEVYDSADEPKAKDLHVRVNYPREWEKESVGNQDMLVQFIRRNEATVEMLMLQVYTIDEEGAKSFFPLPDAEPQEDRYVMWEKTIGSLRNTQLLSVADTAIPSGRPAVLIELVMLPANLEKDIYTRIKMLHVYEKERMVIVSCGAGSVMEKKVEVDVLLTEGMKPICRQYFDSLRFVE